MSDETERRDPLIAVWVVGEVGVPESEIEEKGVVEATQDELGPAGFQVTTAEVV